MHVSAQLGELSGNDHSHVSSMRAEKRHHRGTRDPSRAVRSGHPPPRSALPRHLAHRLLLPVLHTARVFPVWLLSLDRISGRTTRVAAFNESWFALIAVRGVHYRGVAARHHCRWAWEWRLAWGYDPRRCQEHFSMCVWGTRVRTCVWHRPRVVGCPRVRC